MLTHKTVKISEQDRLELIHAKNRLFAKKSEEDMFYELCFCICSPQTTFSKNSDLNKELRARDFFNKPISYETLQELTVQVRFYQRKALFLIEAKRAWDVIYAAVNNDVIADYDKRKWLVTHVRGLGMKTASHFLRNAIGCEYFAILDTHVVFWPF